MNYFVILFCLPLLLFAQGNDETEKVIDVIQQQTNIKDPFKIRDPFKKPTTKAESGIKKKENKYVRSIDYESIDIEKLAVVGVLVGKNSRAFVKDSSNKGVFTLKVGAIIGNQKAELKAILPGGIVLVEKILNVYGQEEFLETIIPIGAAPAGGK